MAGNERMERLKKFQQERARKRAEARAKEPKAPFYVGVYKVGLLLIQSLTRSIHRVMMSWIVKHIW